MLALMQFKHPDASPLVYLIAGEPSGDLLGAKLMVALKAKTGGKVKFAGIGGPRMEAEGLRSLFPFHELALMGFVEILPALPKILARLRLAVKDIIRQQPRCVVTIDSPGFNFQVAEKLRNHRYAKHLKLVHYVAPTVWAYKPQRAEKVARLFDTLMVVLPFEPPYFERVGMNCRFTGHPIVEEWQQHPGEAQHFRDAHALSADTPILTMLPGSRRGEIARHLPIFAQVVRKLRHNYPRLVTVVVTPSHLATEMQDHFRHLNWPLKVILVSNDIAKRDAFAASTLALSKSGTVTLELALAGVPMIVAYKTSRITAWMLSKMLRVKYVNLINLLLDRPLIPELLQENCEPTKLTTAIEELLTNSKARQHQIDSTREAITLLRGTHPETPSEQAAEVVLEMVRASASARA